MADDDDDAARIATATTGFLADAMFYFGVKIVTSLDDLVWLSPFVAIAAVRDRAKVAAVYIAISLGISVVALVLAYLAIHGLTAMLPSSNHHYLSASAILNLVASACIAILAWKEWKSSQEEEEENDDDDNQEDEEQACIMADPTIHANESTPLLNNDNNNKQQQHDMEQPTPPKPDDDDDDKNEDTMRTALSERNYRRHVLMDLLVVGILGQLDTLAVVSSVLMARQTASVVAVMVGSLGAALIILACAYFITLLRPLTRCLQSVPLWAILTVIAVWIFLQAFWE